VSSYMSGYTKLFSSVLDSTVWREKDHVRLVWITMLAMADRDGLVEASVPGLADRARVDLSLCEQALAILSAPDKYSRTLDYEGRRIGKVDGGWTILNHAKYRERASLEAKREAAAIRQQRKRDRHAASRSVTPVTQSHAIASASAEASAKAEASPDRSARAREVVPAQEQKLPEPEQPQGDDGTWKASGCPLDLVSKLDGLGVVRQLAERLGANPVAVRAELDAFVNYWTIGKGMGQQRTGWPGKARQWVIEQARRPGGLKAPGAVEHEARSTVSAEIAKIAGSILRPI
jgi:hypothetical protein